MVTVKTIEEPIPAMRLFVALWPDEELRRRLVGCGGARHWSPHARPVARHNLHVTLAFLGSVPHPAVPGLCRALRTVTLEGCELVFDHLECWHRGLVVLCPQAVPPELVRLHERLLWTSRSLGLEEDKLPFRPHVTLARNARGTVPAPLREPIGWAVRDFALALSDPPGQYRILERFE